MSYDNYYNGKNKVCGCRPSSNYPCADLVWDIYDDDCCDLVKIAYTFYSEKANCIVQAATRLLNELVCGCISRREFEIRYGLFILTIQKINQLVICALRRVLANDKTGAGFCQDNNFLGYDFGCFGNDYCQNAVAAVVCIALDYVREAADIRARLNLGRDVEECVLRLLIERLEDALSLVIQDCCIGKNKCAPCGDPYPGKKWGGGYKKAYKAGKKYGDYEDGY